ncbi:MAG TPA: hypothetical protein V6C84_15555 [Coleofasciculaceae cyanobacterium]
MTAELVRELSKRATGKLFTEAQVQTLTKSIVGKYFSDWLPTPQREAEAEERISAARIHITEATKIISGLQDDLEKQANQLDLLAREIDEKKQIAERYTILAQTNQDALAAFKAEMEETVRKELNAQNEKGKIIRQTVSFASWLIALIAGAFLGAWFQVQLESKVQPSESQPSSQTSR